jgi:hypothetical protein
MHLVIDEKLAACRSRAWRTHERPDGTLASGPADLVEDLLAEHRRRMVRNFAWWRTAIAPLLVESLILRQSGARCRRVGREKRSATLCRGVVDALC